MGLASAQRFRPAGIGDESAMIGAQISSSPLMARAQPLRVLMTADAVGGVWRYSLDLATALRYRGVQTTVAVMGPAPRPEQRREAARARVPLVEHAGRLEWMDDAERDVVEAGE